MRTVTMFLRWILGVLLVGLSAYMVLAGLNTAAATAGTVQGSEFGMLITLAHEAALAITWLGLYALWRLVAVPTAAASTSAPRAGSPEASSTG